MTVDLEAIKEKWLGICGACDAGMGECSHPDGDYRPVMLELVREVERLRGELDEARAEVERLRLDRTVLEGALDGNRIATHNMQRLMEEATTRQWAAESERDQLRAVVQIADEYESAWSRYANPRPGPTETERVLEKANAHQALLDAVRRHRSEVSDA